MAKITWLASYPKSGSTWVRILLANFQDDSGEPVDINRLSAFVSYSRVDFDDHAGLEASCLSAQVVERLQPAAYRAIAEESGNFLLCKVHDKWRRTDRGEPVFPAEVTAGVIYIVRNVLDLAASCAHHWGCDHAAAVQRLCDTSFALGASPDRLSLALPQPLGSWTDHVASWLDQSNLACQLVRYEDLQADAVNAFGAVTRFCGFPDDAKKLARAVARSAFSILQGQERRNGFREASSEAPARFFRRGEAGAWREELAADLVRRLIDAHGDTMRRFGYIDEQGYPVG